MAILLDQNISFRILSRISNAFPEVTHVRLIGLTDFNDYQIYMHARREGYAAIVTLDEDFSLIQLEHKAPPKIIWLRTGNCSTATLSEILVENAGLIHQFLADSVHDCLEIYS